MSELNAFAATALTVAMLACFALIGGGVKLARQPDTRRKGFLMLAAALVILGNVLVWTI